MSGIGIPTKYPLPKFQNVRGPVIDVRSPKEYQKGHIPGAINIPIFTDDERVIVGTKYIKSGRRQAIKEGLKLISPRILEITSTLEITANNYQKEMDLNHSCVSIYCWRGGMRSSSVAWLANLLDIRCITLIGGYKSYRNWVLNQFEIKWPLKLLGGRTGTGKTDILLELEKKGRFIIDLEDKANHRGSSFGGLGLPKQPTCEHYENLLAEDLDFCRRNNAKEILVEAESSNLGKCRVPYLFFKQMKKSPVLEISRTIEERLIQLVNIYSKNTPQELNEATKRISKRLGPQRTKKALDAISKGDWSSACKEMLDYYDRCYDYELSKVPSRENIDLSGLNPIKSAEKLIKEGFVY